MAAEKVEKVCCLYRLGENTDSLEIIYMDDVSTITLGRAETNDYLLNESPAVSRRHALLEKTGSGIWSITDLASSNGIYINYKRIVASQPHPLEDRDIVEIGKDPRSNQTAAYRFQFYKQAKVKRSSGTEESNPRAKRQRVHEQSGMPGTADENCPLQEVQTNNSIMSPSKALLRQKMAEQENLLRKKMEDQQREAESKLKALEEELARREEEQKKRMEEIEKQKLLLTTELQEQKEQQERLSAEQQELGKRLQETELAKESMAQQLQEEQERISKQLQEQDDIKRQLDAKEMEYSASMEAARLDAERQVNKLTELLEAKEMQQEEMEQEKASIEQQLQLQKELLTLEQEKFKEEMTRKLDQQLHEQVEEVKVKLEQEITSLQDERKKVEESLQTQLTKQLQEKDQQLEEELRKQQENLNLKLAQKEQEQKSLQEQLTATKTEVEQAKQSGQMVKQALTSQMEDLMESELICAICSEFFIQATSLNCSHSFCALCIGKWMNRKKECPNCRAKITSSVRSLVLDNYIDKMVEYLGEEVKENRKTMVQQRKAEQAQLDEAKKKAGNRATPPPQPAIAVAGVGINQGTNRAEQLAFDLTQYLQGQQVLPRAIQGQRIPRIDLPQVIRAAGATARAAGVTAQAAGVTARAAGVAATQARQNAAAVAAAIGRTNNLNNTIGAAPGTVHGTTVITVANQRTATVTGRAAASTSTSTRAPAANTGRVDPRVVHQGAAQVVPGTSGLGRRVTQGSGGHTDPRTNPALAQVTTAQQAVRIAPYIPVTGVGVSMNNVTNATPVMYVTQANQVRPAPGTTQYQTLYYGTNTVTIPVGARAQTVTATNTNPQRHPQSTRPTTITNPQRHAPPTRPTTTTNHQQRGHSSTNTNQQRHPPSTRPTTTTNHQQRGHTSTNTNQQRHSNSHNSTNQNRYHRRR